MDILLALWAPQQWMTSRCSQSLITLADLRFRAVKLQANSQLMSATPRYCKGWLALHVFPSVHCSLPFCLRLPSPYLCGKPKWSSLTYGCSLFSGSWSCSVFINRLSFKTMPLPLKNRNSLHFLPIHWYNHVSPIPEAGFEVWGFEHCRLVISLWLPISCHLPSLYFGKSFFR